MTDPIERGTNDLGQVELRAAQPTEGTAPTESAPRGRRTARIVGVAAAVAATIGGLGFGLPALGQVNLYPGGPSTSASAGTSGNPLPSASSWDPSAPNTWNPSAPNTWNPSAPNTWNPSAPNTWNPSAPPPTRPTGTPTSPAGYCPIHEPSGLITYPTALDPLIAGSRAWNSPADGAPVPFHATRVLVCRYTHSGPDHGTRLAGAADVTDAATVGQLRAGVNSVGAKWNHETCPGRFDTAYVVFTTGHRGQFLNLDVTDCFAWMQPQDYLLPAAFAQRLTGLTPDGSGS